MRPTEESSAAALHALQELAVELGRSSALDRNLALILSTTTRLLQHERAAVLVFDGGRDVLRFAASVGYDPADVGRGVPVDAAALRAVITGVQCGQRIEPPVPIRAAIALSVDERALGIIALERDLEAEEPWLVAVASHASAAIDRAQLRSEVDASEAELEHRVSERTLELKRTQARMLEAQKMAALVHLVAGITHEMNSPLGALVSASDTIERAVAKLRAPEAVPSPGILGALSDSNRAIGDACRRIDGIVRQLKSFVRLDEAVKQEIGVEKCIEEALALLQHRLERISVVRDYSETEPIVCYPARLNEVFSTILRNACDAVEQKDDAKIVVRTRAYRGTVSIEIDDNGVGMSEEEIQRVFEPAFNTKGARIRMGLGLAIAHQVVGDHGGEIAFESQIGLGTKVSVEIPVTPKSPAAARDPR